MASRVREGDRGVPHPDQIARAYWLSTFTVTLFFISNLAVFYVLAVARTPHLGIPFYIWIGVFNVGIVAQFWAFANDVYTPEQGKRLFVIVAFGANFGAVVGGAVTPALSSRSLR